MKNPLIIIVPIIILIVGLIAFFAIKKPAPTSQNKITSTAPSQETTKTVEGYQGQVIAGTASPFIIFNKEDYDKALSEGKIIVLDFYANWCPICRSEAPQLNSGFEELNSGKVVGFRVNFSDSDTDDDEKQLAKDFNIPYQHTKVIVKNGAEVERSADHWDKETFLKEVSSQLQ